MLLLNQKWFNYYHYYYLHYDYCKPFGAPRRPLVVFGGSRRVIYGAQNRFHEGRKGRTKTLQKMIWALEAVKTSQRHSHYWCYFISNMRSWGNGVWRSSSRQIRKVTRRRVTFSFSLDVSLSALFLFLFLLRLDACLLACVLTFLLA